MPFLIKVALQVRHLERSSPAENLHKTNHHSIASRLVMIAIYAEAKSLFLETFKLNHFQASNRNSIGKRVLQLP